MEKSPRPAQLEAAIREIIQELLEMPVTAHVRELRAKAVTYGRVIGNWSVYAPTTPQVQAMRECVTELRQKVIAAKGSEVSKVRRRPPESASSPAPAKDEPTTEKQRRKLLPPPYEPSARSGPPAGPSVPPAGMAWNANLADATGVHARSRATSSEPATRPPPQGTAPPESMPRPVEPGALATPVPEVFRTTRSR